MSIGAIGSSSYASITSTMMSRLANSQKTDATDFASEIIKAEDKDGDGKISADESRVDSKRFLEIDADGDGLITAEELTTSVKSNTPETFGGPPPMPGLMMDPSKMASRIVEQDDANGDGVLSVDETSMDSEMFSAIDADGDGSLTVEELTEDMEARQAEMEEKMSEARDSLLSQLGTDDDELSLADLLSRNSARSAYEGQNSLYAALKESYSGRALSA